MKIAFLLVEKIIITPRLYYTSYYSKHGRNYSISAHFRGNLTVSISRRSLRYLHLTFAGCGKEKYTGSLGKLLKEINRITSADLSK